MVYPHWRIVVGTSLRRDLRSVDDRLRDGARFVYKDDREDRSEAIVRFMLETENRPQTSKKVGLVVSDTVFDRAIIHMINTDPRTRYDPDHPEGSEFVVYDKDTFFGTLLVVASQELVHAWQARFKRYSPCSVPVREERVAFGPSVYAYTRQKGEPITRWVDVVVCTFAHVGDRNIQAHRWKRVFVVVTGDGGGEGRDLSKHTSLRSDLKRLTCDRRWVFVAKDPNDQALREIGHHVLRVPRTQLDVDEALDRFKTHHVLRVSNC